MSQNRVIGKENKLPWKMPADLAYFKKVTLNNTVIMGRKTFESIGRPLPQRQNIILTKNPDELKKQFPDLQIVNSIHTAIQLAEYPIFIIGGSSIYQELLPFANVIYLTLIKADFDGDCFFPELDNSWKVTSREEHPADEKNPHAYQFLILKKQN